MGSIALMPFLMSLFLSTTIFLNTFSSYASLLTYTDHCASMVPNTTPNESKFKVFPLAELQVGYYLGGSDDSLRNRKQKHVTLRIKNVYETNVSGILNVGAMLMVPSATTYYHVNVGNSTHANIWHCKRSSIRFSLYGFWSESSGKLCMIGSEIGECLEHLEIVLKLYNVVNLSNTISTLVTGRFESLSPKHEVSYFEPISLFIFPRMGYDYEYTLDTKEAKNESSDEGGLVPGLAINLIRLCSNIYPMINGIYDLQYHSDCYSEKNCSPLWGDSRQLPYIVSLEGMVCSDVKQRVKVLIGFGNIDSGYRWSFNPNATLVGEGWWDERKNQLHVIACRFLGVEESVASVHVGDCSTRMSLRIPKIWSINDASSIVGQIWSNKTVGDAAYFKRIILRSHQDKRTRVSGIKYEYTKLEKVRKLCPRQEPLKNKGIRYPYVNSSDMRIEFSVGYSDQILAWGYCDPLVINDQIQQKNLDENFVPKSSHTQPFISANSSSTYLYNISYQISFSLVPDAKLGEENSIFNTTENATETVNVSAEGVYDVEAGSLCMVGCRNLGSENKMPTTASVDCEILVKFQFLPPNAKNNGCYNIKGSMESNRKISDPLYFKPLDLFSVAFYTTEAK
ncbi:hypothetical protein VNO77_37366 [Canavalia gladiata]|uniref:DUF2921 domain-containing protein n=1 Tax=Canavalia gladiata TaxID=3824 RepID=A0AAN9KA81_CANGL